ncbi:MAG: hypothetical protein IJC76_08805 [Lachnospiraceae bacterium]|nr:hypothetical protein [Lachnospiraceae bacterium]
MINSFEDAKEARDITNLIMQDIDAHKKANEKTNESVQNENVEELIKVLVKILNEKVSLRYYIEQYIKKMLGKELDSAQIDDTIKQGFEQVGFSIKEKNELLKKLTYSTDSLKREDLCLYAIGLDISDEYLSMLMQKVLHQRGFNPRSYKEIIYRWCNFNYRNKRRVIKEKADALINLYESEDFCIDNEDSCDLESGKTLVCPQKSDLDRLLDMKEEELKKYLSGLKAEKLCEDKSSLIQQKYLELMNNLCSINFNYLSDGKSLDLNKVKKQKDGTIKNLSVDLLEININRYLKVLYNDETKVVNLNNNQWEEIFKGIDITNSKYIQRTEYQGDDIIKFEYKKDNAVEFEKYAREEISKKLDNKETVSEVNYRYRKPEECEAILVKLKSVNSNSINMYRTICLLKGKKEGEDGTVFYREVKEPNASNRKELILLKFLTFANGYDDRYFEHMSKFGKAERGVVDFVFFEDEVNKMLKSLNMSEWYVHDPYELFITICFLQKKMSPFDYFMKGWAIYKYEVYKKVEPQIDDRIRNLLKKESKIKEYVMVLFNKTERDKERPINHIETILAYMLGDKIIKEKNAELNGLVSNNLDDKAKEKFAEYDKEVIKKIEELKVICGMMCDIYSDIYSEKEKIAIYKKENKEKYIFKKKEIEECLKFWRQKTNAYTLIFYIYDNDIYMQEEIKESNLFKRLINVLKNNWKEYKSSIEGYGDSTSGEAKKGRLERFKEIADKESE